MCSLTAPLLANRDDSLTLCGNIFRQQRSSQNEKSQFDFLGVRRSGAQRLLYSGLQFAK